MTVYNRENYLAEAIESVLNSTYSNFELIIVDDNSKDRSFEIAQGYARTDQRIRLYKNPTNLGDYPNRNMAASHAKGEYLKFVDADDKILDFGLAYCVEQMEKSPEAALGIILEVDLGIDDSACWGSPEMIHNHFFGGSYLSKGPTGSIYRRNKFEDLGGFNVKAGVHADTHLNIRLAARNPVVLLSKVFFYYREHAEQQRYTMVSEHIKCNLIYYKDIMENEELPIPNVQVKYLTKKMYKRHSINLTRYLFKTRDWKTFRRIMQDTHFSYGDYFSGFIK
jgi:glycosyltransferase involved in cell wall biosynthesis